MASVARCAGSLLNLRGQTRGIWPEAQMSWQLVRHIKPSDLAGGPDVKFGNRSVWMVERREGDVDRRRLVLHQHSERATAIAAEPPFAKIGGSPLARLSQNECMVSTANGAERDDRCAAAELTEAAMTIARFEGAFSKPITDRAADTAAFEHHLARRWAIYRHFSTAVGSEGEIGLTLAVLSRGCRDCLRPRAPQLVQLALRLCQIGIELAFIVQFLAEISDGGSCQQLLDHDPLSFTRRECSLLP